MLLHIVWSLLTTVPVSVMLLKCGGITIVRSITHFNHFIHGIKDGSTVREYQLI